MKPNRVTTQILIAILAGILAGVALNLFIPDAATRASVTGVISQGSTIFLRLIKMALAPLIFSTLTVGVGKMTDAATVGRVGSKALLLFVIASFASLGIGMLMVNLFQPGAGIHRAMQGGSSDITTHLLTLNGFIAHMVPDSAVRALADNEILQIVVLSLFMGMAAASMPERARAFMEWTESLSHIILRVTSYVMALAPIAVFCAMAAAIGHDGPGILANYAKFIGEFYLALFCLWAFMLGASALFLGRSALRLTRLVQEPMLLAFSTASSEAAYSIHLEQLGKFPIARRISSFVLPLAYSFNLVGTMMYCAFGSIFIAQAYDIPLPLGTQLFMLLTLMLISKGAAGVPRAGLVAVAATISQFGLPQDGLMLLVGVDALLDMGRTGTNILGNSFVTALVAKWENQLVMDDDARSMIEDMEEPALATGDA